MSLIERTCSAIDRINERVGQTVAWAALAMVLIQFLVVILRYVFGFGSILMQESVIYLHAILFLMGSGYTLLHNGHVRVDIFYRDAKDATKAKVDLIGVLVFLLPVCALIWWGSWSYIQTSWQVLEGSKETSGIHAVYLLKTVILAFVALISLQGVSVGLRALLVIRTREIDET